MIRMSLGKKLLISLSVLALKEESLFTEGSGLVKKIIIIINMPMKTVREN